MKLYIANCTRQIQYVYYRLDFTSDGQAANLRRFQPARKSPEIRPGRQIVLFDAQVMQQIDDIVTQLERHGIVAEKEAKAVRGRGVVPYVYNIDRPVSASAIRDVYNHNIGVLREQGRTRRETSAVVASQMLQTDSPVEVEFEQLEATEGATDETRLEEGFRVMKGVSDVPPSGGRRNTRRQRAA